MFGFVVVPRGFLRPVRACMSIFGSIKTIEICAKGWSIRGGLGIQRSKERVVFSRGWSLTPLGKERNSICCLL
jgi:hypothetical protein